MLDVIRRNSQSFWVKIIFALIIIVFVFWGATSINSGAVEEVAEINGEPIYFAEFYRQYQRELNSFKAEQGIDVLTPEQEKVFALVTMRRMGQSKLMLQEASSLGLNPSNRELFNYIATTYPEFKGEDGNFNFEIYEAVLKANGLSPVDFERSVASNIATQKVIDSVISSAVLNDNELRHLFNFREEGRSIDFIAFNADNYKGSVSITDEEISARYDQNIKAGAYKRPAQVALSLIRFSPDALANSVTVTSEEVRSEFDKSPERYFVPGQFHARHIMLFTPEDRADDSVESRIVFDKIEAIKADILAGKISFAQAAEQFSEEKNSAQAGGDLGVLVAGQIRSPEFDAAALSLKEGEISNPVKTQYGYHIIELVEASTPERLKTFEEAAPEIKETLAIIKGNDALKLAINDVDNIIIKQENLGEVAPKYGLKVEEIALSNVDTVAQSTSMPKEMLDKLNVYTVGSLLPVPINTPDGGFIVASLDEYKAAYDLPLSDVKTEINDLLVHEKSALLASNAAHDLVLAIQANNGELPAAELSKVKASDSTTRFVGFAQLGLPQSATALIFSTDLNAWITEPLDTFDGAIVAQVKTVTVPDDDAWATQMPLVKMAVTNMRQEELLNFFRYQLEQTNDVKYHGNPLERSER